jgi:hypothetical protein
MRRGKSRASGLLAPGWCAAGSDCMLIGAGDRGISAHRPVLVPASSHPARSQSGDLLPGVIQRPAAMPVMTVFQFPKPPAGIATAARPGAGEDSVDHRAVIDPPAAARRIGWQEHPQALPLRWIRRCRLVYPAGAIYRYLP